MNRRPLVIVGGVIANKLLNGGAAWTRLSWVLGFQQLGFEVYFLEQIAAADCVDDRGRKSDFESSANLRHFRKVTERFGLNGTAALVCGDGQNIHGMSSGELCDLASDADMIVNISGHIRLPCVMQSAACKVLVDLDPGLTQLWYRAGLLAPEFRLHDRYFTIGEAIGSPACSLPQGDIAWEPTRQPVVLPLWPVSVLGEQNRLTTVAAWRDDCGTIEHEGQTLGLKVHEFRRFVTLPARVSQSCEIVLDIHDEDRADLESLRRHGWVIRDPRTEVPDPDSFRRYVQESGAEFSVAKGVYVQTQCAWFSDRSVRYLASGKPALVQDTGFSRIYPVGEGLLAFSSLADAVSGAASIADNYPAHCRAARELAEHYFDSDRVLGDLAERVGILP